MSVVKFRDLERFKKTRAGLIEFACLVEQAAPKVREKIIEQVSQLDPTFLRSALRKVVYFEELVFLEDSALAEILGHVSPKILAFALVDTEPEFSKKMMAYLGYRQMKQAQDEQEKMGKKPSEAMVFGARVQVLKIARELEAKNKFVFELLDCPRFQQTEKKRLRLVRSK
jgi:flagellar motor switch protein FliG